jgi:hypothetical protein
MVNSAFQWGTQAAGMQQSPGYVMGQRPSDTFFVSYGGSERLESSHKKLMGHINILDALRAQGGGAEELADRADAFGPMATAYLGQYNTVQQAMGGNLDDFSRRMLGGATSISGGGTLAGAPGGNSWQRQQAFHEQHLARARSLGTSILDRAYTDPKTGVRNPFNIQKDFTRGFQIEQVADVVTQLGYEGSVAWMNRDGTVRTDNENMDMVDRRLGKLAAARNVFGDADVNTLQQKTQGLLGSSLGSNDDASTKILQQISAEARVLNKDVDNMVKSREVIKNTLVAINKARDSRGVNLTYDGSGSVSGDLEVTANAIGSIVDHATAGLPQKVQEGMGRNMTRTMIKDIDSDAGRLAKLMQSAVMSGEVSQDDYSAFLQATRAGNTRGASDIARRSIRDVDKIMNNQQLYENTVGYMTDEGIRRMGSKEAYQEYGEMLTTERVEAIGRGAHHQTQDRMIQQRVRRQMGNMRRLYRMTGVKEDERTDEEKMADYKQGLVKGANAYKSAEMTKLENDRDSGLITKGQFIERSANLDLEIQDDIDAINMIEADNVSELRGMVRSGKAGVSEARADKIADVADATFQSNRERRYVEKVKGTGKLESRIRLDFLKSRGFISGEDAKEILAMDDKADREARIEGIVKDKFGPDDARAEEKYRSQTDAEIKRERARSMSDKMSSSDRGMVTDHLTEQNRKHTLGGIQKQGARGTVVKQTADDDMEAAEKLAKDKNNVEKVASGIESLIKAITDGREANMENYEDGALKVKVINPNDLKTQKSMVEDGSGGK